MANFPVLKMELQRKSGSSTNVALLIVVRFMWALLGLVDQWAWTNVIGRESDAQPDLHVIISIRPYHILFDKFLLTLSLPPVIKLAAVDCEFSLE